MPVPSLVVLLVQVDELLSPGVLSGLEVAAHIAIAVCEPLPSWFATPAGKWSTRAAATSAATGPIAVASWACGRGAACQSGTVSVDQA